MELQVLVSTMKQVDYKLINKMNIKSDSIIINQCNENSTQDIKKDNSKIKWINSKGRGLSKSRNIALKYATANICVLADDDLEYITNYKDVILEQFELYPNADIIAFQVEGIERKFKNYNLNSRRINFLTSMKISSVEIAFRLERIKKSNINFNELFGAGARYYMGEESIFLMECLRKGLKIIYVPQKIANLHIDESTWFQGYNEDYFINKGAAFTTMTKPLSLILIIQFAVRKHALFKNSMSFINSIRFMREGHKQYLNILKNKN